MAYQQNQGKPSPRWGLSLCPTQRALVLSALEQSLFTHRRTNVEFTTTGLLHHSDAGSQGGFNRSLQHLNVRSVDGQASGMVERTDGSESDDLAGRHPGTRRGIERVVWELWRQVEQAAASRVHWYNTERLHSSIADVPPVDYEEIYYDRTRGSEELAAA